MTYNLFIDDERYPALKDKRDYVIVRTAVAAIDTVRLAGMPRYITFDHDLGIRDGRTIDVMPFVHWFKDYILDNQPDLTEFRYDVHSQNPIGRKNIGGLLDPLIGHAMAGYR